MIFSSPVKRVLVVAVLALTAGIATTTAHAQGKSQKSTPANAGVCDSLKESTPGLYGLCTGFCEAQKCTAEYDPVTNTITLGPNCKPSSNRLLDKYNDLAAAGDPPMPCVNYAVNECPCWTSSELADVADADPASSCQNVQGYDASIFGWDKNMRFRLEFAFARQDPDGGNTCSYMEITSGKTLFMDDINENQAMACISTIESECAKRNP